MPGAGKSTIVRELVKDDNFRIVKIRKKSELICLNLKYLFSHPIKFFKLFILVLKNSKSYQEFYYKFMNCFLDYNAKFQKAKKFDKAILDQGYFQNIISLFSFKMNMEDLKNYRNIIMLPDKLFIIDLDKEERQNRLGERGFGVRKDFDKNDNEKFLELAEKNYNYFLEHKEDIIRDLYLIDSRKQVLDTVKNIKNLLKV